MTNKVVEIKDLDVTLGSARILHDVSFSVERGTTLAVLGANGSGKSTLIKTLVGINPVTRGDVRIFGVSIKDRSSIPWERIGYAPQRVTTTAGIPATALETVMSGFVYGWRVRPPRGAKAKALAALDLVGLMHRAHESVQKFSGGQQQRVLIARALVKEPDFIVFDEPFAGVDTESRAQIVRALASAHESGATIILILHELYDLEEFIDKGIVLDHGRLVAHYDSVSEIEHGPGHGVPHEHLHEHQDIPPHYRTPHLGGTIK